MTSGKPAAKKTPPPKAPVAKAAAPSKTSAPKSKVKVPPVAAKAAKGAGPKKGKNAKGPAGMKAAVTNSPLFASTKSSRSSEAHGGAVCREVACELMATTNGYCRLHYIKNWKKIKRKELILRERKLNHYIEELVSKYPDKYIEALRQDLASEKDFSKVISDLEIEENLDDFEVESEGDEGIIDNIKREFEEDDETF